MRTTSIFLTAMLTLTAEAATFSAPTVENSVPADCHFETDGNIAFGTYAKYTELEVYPDREGGYYAIEVHYRQYIVAAPDGTKRFYMRKWITYSSNTRPPPPDVSSQFEPPTWQEADALMETVGFGTAMQETYGVNQLSGFIGTQIGGGGEIDHFFTHTALNPCSLEAIRTYSIMPLFHILKWQVESRQRGTNIWANLDPNGSGLPWWRNRVVLANPDWDGDGITNMVAIEMGLDPLAGGYQQSEIKDDDGNMVDPGDNAAWDACDCNVVVDAGPDQTVEAGMDGGAQITLLGTGTSKCGDDLIFTWTSVPGFMGSVTGTNPTVTLPIGTYTVMLTVSKPTGESATDTLTVVVRDSAPPVFSNLPGDMVVEQASPAGTTLSLPMPTAWDLCDTNVTVTSNAPATFPPGKTTVTFTATDFSGNATTATMSVTVVDTTAPVLSNVPANVAVEQAAPQGTALVLNMPTATDAADPAPTITSNAPAIFPAGVTTVTFTATDAAGNSSSATMTVTVADTTAPVLNDVPANMAVEQATPEGTALTLNMPTATDAADGAPVVSSNAPAIFPAGVTTVTFTATDAAGNSSAATMTVTVQDTIAPVLSNVPADVSVVETPGGTAVSLTMPTAADAADASPVVTSNAPALFPVGVTVVTFTATDKAGNSSTATTQVTVTSSVFDITALRGSGGGENAVSTSSKAPKDGLDLKLPKKGTVTANFSVDWLNGNRRDGMAKFAIERNGASPDSGTFGAGSTAITFSKPGKFTITAWLDRNGNDAIDAGETVFRMDVQIKH